MVATADHLVVAEHEQRPVEALNAYGDWIATTAYGQPHPRGHCRECVRHDFAVQWVSSDGEYFVPWPVEDVREIASR